MSFLRQLNCFLPKMFKNYKFLLIVLLLLGFSNGQYASLPFQPQVPVAAPPNVVSNPSDALQEYENIYGAMPPAYPPQQSHIAEKNTTETLTPATEQETPEQKEEATELASQLAPDSAFELKRVIASQQNELSKIRSQVAELIDELKNERQRVAQEKAAAAGIGKKNALSLNIEFPESTTKEAPVPKAKTTKINPEEITKSIEDQALISNKPIPVLIVKPDPMQDVEQLSEQIIEQEMTEDAIHETDAELPVDMQLKTPQERASEAIAAIDKLEAEKAKIEAETRILKKKIETPGIGASIMQGLAAGLTQGQGQIQSGMPIGYIH